MDTPGTSFGTGGMATKLIAAELATAGGVATVIISSERPADIVDVVNRGLPSRRGDDSQSAQTQTPSLPSMTSSIASLDAEEANLIGHPPLINPAHTLFLPQSTPLPSRKWSILHALHPTGRIIIDEGAYRRLKKPESGGRLLPAGVVEISGYWQRMQAVRLVVRQAVKDTDPTLSKVATSAASVALGQERVNAIKNAVEAATTATPTTASTSSTTTTSSSHSPSTQWQDVEVGRCLANYTSSEIDKIRGLKSMEIERVLGFVDSEYVTDTVVLVD